MLRIAFASLSFNNTKSLDICKSTEYKVYKFVAEKFGSKNVVKFCFHHQNKENILYFFCLFNEGCINYAFHLKISPNLLISRKKTYAISRFLAKYPPVTISRKQPISPKLRGRLKFYYKLL